VAQPEWREEVLEAHDCRPRGYQERRIGAGGTARRAPPQLPLAAGGRGELSAALGTCLADPGVDVVWDRRLAERRCRVERVAGEGRAGQRRGPPPSSWRWPGLVIVEAPGKGVGSAQVPRKRILVVEDVPRVREVLHQALGAPTRRFSSRSA